MDLSLFLLVEPVVKGDCNKWVGWWKWIFLQEHWGLGEAGLISLYSYKECLEMISSPNIPLVVPGTALKSQIESGIISSFF